MTRAINDGFNAHEFMVEQKDSKTKVAMLTQWKNLVGLRNDLRRRLAALTGLTGASLVWLTPTEDDQAIAELERQQEQKERVLQMLQKRLREVPEHELAEEDIELLQICEQ